MDKKTAATSAQSNADCNPYSLRNFLKVGLLVFSIAATLHSTMRKGEWVWFSWHPLSMIMSFVFIAGYSILTKKDGGYVNTKLHGYFMMAAVLLALFGWYVIYSNKEMYGKPHVVTLHAQIGVAVMLGYIGMTIFGLVALWPDGGIFKTNKTVRFLHKWFGRVLTGLSWVCCVYGFNTIESRPEYQMMFAIPLAIFAYFVLL
mmetsp:Transcript_12481/g.18863  ORF Transcript_12481/g.18863 Transcript_12481/m.18863 type:complete len:202 (-) Transcript_12481:77-682(-)